MTTTPVTPVPILLSNVTLQIGASHTFEKACSAVAIVPSTSIVNFTGMSPGAQYGFPTSPTWTVTITAAQDLQTASSLHNYLLANGGTQATLVFTPNAADPLSTVTVTAILVAPQIGGDVNTVGTFSVTLGVQGQPTIVSGS